VKFHLSKMNAKVISVALGLMLAFLPTCALHAQSSNNQEANAFYAQGAKYLDAGDYAKALEAFKKAVDLDPNLSDAVQGEGVCHYELGNFALARTAFLQYLSRKKDNATIFILVGKSDIELKNYTEAEQAFQSAIGLKPDTQNLNDAYYNLGLTYYYLHQFPKSVTAYQQALRLQPRDAVTLSDLGVVYVQLGRRDDAIQVYKTLLPIDTKRAQGLLDSINQLQSSPSQARQPSER
jgi:tetratricopeptide (TPR) repeat protein